MKNVELTKKLFWELGHRVVYIDTDKGKHISHFILYIIVFLIHIFLIRENPEIITAVKMTMGSN